MESHLQVQIQEDAGARNYVLEFENPMPEINLPEEPAHDLQEGCTFGVNENHIGNFKPIIQQALLNY